VLKFLAGGTLVGLLPLPTPIMVRRYVRAALGCTATVPAPCHLTVLPKKENKTGGLGWRGARRYKPTAATRLWMTVQLWGVIYLSHLNPPVWYGTQIALFIIHSVQPPV